jgi:F-type H+-transporting ATPase subunit b
VDNDPMRRTAIATAAFLLTTVSPLLAQHGGEEQGGLLSLSGGLSFWTLVIFLIVLAVLAKFAYPKILGAVEAREEHIAELTASAERDRAEAAALADENRRLLEETRARVQEALATSRAQAEQEKARALDEVRAQREELMARARADIEAERRVMADQVRAETVDIAMAAAEKLVRRNLDGDANRRLVMEYLSGIGAGRPAAAAAGD